MSISERLAESALSNPRADRVKAVAGLARRSARSKQGKFLAEGPQNVREALTAHLASVATGIESGSASADFTTTAVPLRVDLLPGLDALYVTEDCLERHPDIAELLQRVLDASAGHFSARRVFIRIVTEEVLRVISDAQHPQGAVAVCTMPNVGLADVMGTNAAPAAHAVGTATAATARHRPIPVRLVAALCRVQDPGNVGTIIRAADAAGADAVVLTEGSVDLFNPKTVRSTAGSLFHLPVITQVDVSEVTGWGDDTQILAADGYGALDLDVLQDASAAGYVADCDLAAPTVWLFGNEAQGLSGAEKAAADHRVAVPLYGQAESLNVGTAATLCLYASARAQRRSPSS